MSLEDGLTAFKRNQYAEAIAHLSRYCRDCEASGSTGSRNYMQAGMSLVKAYHRDRQLDQAIAQCEAFMACDTNPALQIWANRTRPKLTAPTSESVQDSSNPAPERTVSAPAPATATAPARAADNLQTLKTGLAAQKRGDYTLAIQSIEAYLTTCTNRRSRAYIQAQIARTKSYRDSGQVDRAIAICEELLTLNENPALQNWATKAFSALRSDPRATPVSSNSTQPSASTAPTADTPAFTSAIASISASSLTPRPNPTGAIASTPTARATAPSQPGVARMLDNTQTVIVSAIPGQPTTFSSSSSPSPSSPPSSSSPSLSSFSNASPSPAQTRGRSAKSSRTSSRARPAAAPSSSGPAALIGGGILALLFQWLVRRGGGVILFGLVWGLRACFSGGYIDGAESYASFSPIHQAACEGDTTELETLIQGGTDVNAPDDSGNTPLFWAVSGCSSFDSVSVPTEGHAAVTTSLLNHGASVDIANAYGETPLHWAAAWGSATTIASLLNQGADWQAVDEYQSTPLHWAAWSGNLSTAEVLVNVGADLNPQNLDGETPLDAARYDPANDAVAAFLQSRGGVASIE